MGKICTGCKQVLELSEFNKHKATKDNLTTKCKLCVKNYNEMYRIAHKDDIKQSKSEYYIKNKTSCNKKSSEWQINNKQSRSLIGKKYRLNNKEKIRKSDILYRDNNKHKIRQRIKSWKIINGNIYEKERIKVDVIFALSKRLRNNIRQSIRNQKYPKTLNTQDILGCSFEEFKIHIENQFVEDMSWENRHLWHLDHIYPVSKAIDEEHLLKLNHYTNFQPLWAEDNIRKSNNII